MGRFPPLLSLLLGVCFRAGHGKLAGAGVEGVETPSPLQPCLDATWEPCLAHHSRLLTFCSAVCTVNAWQSPHGFAAWGDLPGSQPSDPSSGVRYSNFLCATVTAANSGVFRVTATPSDAPRLRQLPFHGSFWKAGNHPALTQSRKKIFSSLSKAEPVGTGASPHGPGLFMIPFQLAQGESRAALWRGSRGSNSKTSFTPSRLWPCEPLPSALWMSRWFPKLLKCIPELICCEGRMASEALRGIKTKISNFNMQMADLIH